MTAAVSPWKRAKGWPGWALLFVALVALFAIGGTRDSGPRSPEERVEAIAKRLACPVCDGESVFESRNNASAAIRDQIKSDVDDGALSDDEIVAGIERSYGASVLLVPQATGVEALAWALPVAALVCAVAGLVVAFRRWKVQSLAHATDADRAIVEAALAAEREADGDGSGPTDPPATHDLGAADDPGAVDDPRAADDPSGPDVEERRDDDDA